jgi:hypothetical protein
MLDEFARRLQEMLRTSDVSTRTSETRLWLFLPFSSVAGFTARLQTLFEQQPLDTGLPMQVKIRSVQAPAEVRDGERCDDLMQRLSESEG